MRLFIRNALLYGMHPVLVAQYFRVLKQFPNIALPRTYNEKFLWRKIFDKNPRFPELANKVIYKNFVRQRCPELRVVDSLWEGDRPEDIPDALLDSPVVVKTNHGCRFNLFLPDGVTERNYVNTTINQWLERRPYGKWQGEWAYSCIKPGVIVEPLIKQSDGSQPLNLNVHCFYGNAVLAEVFTGDPHGEVQVGVFDPHGNKIPGKLWAYRAPEQALPGEFKVPTEYDRAIRLAGFLSTGLDHARVDFMCCNNELIANEITFYHAAGYGRWTNPEISRMLNESWDLTRSWFLTASHAGWADRYVTHLNSNLVSRQELLSKSLSANQSSHG